MERPCNQGSPRLWITHHSTWTICGYLGPDYRSIVSLGCTCRGLYEAISDEGVWYHAACCVLPPDALNHLKAAHTRKLNAEHENFVSHDLSEAARGYLPCGFEAWNAFLPGFFLSAVREHVQRTSHMRMQQFLVAAMSCHRFADAKAFISGRSSALLAVEQYVSQVHDIRFPDGCIGRSGAWVLAASLERYLTNNSGSKIFGRLKRVDLSHQLIRDDGAISLLEALSSLPEVTASLEVLNLSDNKITDAPSTALKLFLTRALSCRDSSLRIVDLSDNPQVTGITLMALSTALTQIAGTGDDATNFTAICNGDKGNQSSSPTAWCCDATVAHRVAQQTLAASVKRCRSPRLQLILDGTNVGSIPDGRLDDSASLSSAWCSLVHTLHRMHLRGFTETQSRYLPSTVLSARNCGILASKRDSVVFAVFHALMASAAVEPSVASQQLASPPPMPETSTNRGIPSKFVVRLSNDVSVNKSVKLAVSPPNDVPLAAWARSLAMCPKPDVQNLFHSVPGDPAVVESQSIQITMSAFGSLGKAKSERTTCIIS